MRLQAAPQEVVKQKVWAYISAALAFHVNSVSFSTRQRDAAQTQSEELVGKLGTFSKQEAKTYKALRDDFKMVPLQLEQYVFMSLGPSVSHYGYHLGD